MSEPESGGRKAANGRQRGTAAQARAAAERAGVGLRAVVLTVALAGLAFGSVRFVAAVQLAPYASVARELPDGGQVEPTRLDRAVDAYAGVAGWYGHPRQWRTLGQLTYGRALRAAPTGSARADDLDAAIAAHRRALAKAPLHGPSWVRLSAALLRRSGPTETFFTAFRRAHQVWPNVQTLMATRAAIALRIWPLLPDDQRATSRRHLAVLARAAPRLLAGELAAGSAQRRLALDLLTGDPLARCRLAAAFQRRSAEGCVGPSTPAS